MSKNNTFSLKPDFFQGMSSRHSICNGSCHATGMVAPLLSRIEEIAGEAPVPLVLQGIAHLFGDLSDAEIASLEAAPVP
jgi:hypothetical protein